VQPIESADQERAFSLWTRLSPEDCRLRLDAKVMPERYSSFQTIFSTGQPNIAGRVSGRGFAIHPARGWPGRLPLGAVGRFHPAPDGTRIDVRLAPYCLPLLGPLSLLAFALVAPLFGLEMFGPVLLGGGVLGLLGWLVPLRLSPATDGKTLREFLQDTLDAEPGPPGLEPSLPGGALGVFLRSWFAIHW
jgi:hypothetical protein